MATPEEQVKRTEHAFERLADWGKQWVSLEDVALQAMKEDRIRRRQQRSRFLNSVRDIILRDDPPVKPSFRYRHQTALALMALEDDGRVERSFLDQEGHHSALEDLPPPRSSKDVRFHLIPEPADGRTNPG